MQLPCEMTAPAEDYREHYCVIMPSEDSISAHRQWCQKESASVHHHHHVVPGEESISASSLMPGDMSTGAQCTVSGARRREHQCTISGAGTERWEHQCVRRRPWQCRDLLWRCFILHILLINMVINQGHVCPRCLCVAHKAGGE